MANRALRDQAGVCQFTTIMGDELVIEEAAPVILVAGDLVQRLPLSASRYMRYGDGILTLLGSNMTVSYGLTDYDPLTNTWVGIMSGDHV
jgi:hypothetical protein